MLRQQEKHMKKRNAEHLMGPVATVFAVVETGAPGCGLHFLH